MKEEIELLNRLINDNSDILCCIDRKSSEEAMEEYLELSTEISLLQNILKFLENKEE